MDKFESMRAFTQVVISGGFAAAARDMGVSRSVVNKLVIALENELGVQLLHRSTRVVTFSNQPTRDYLDGSVGKNSSQSGWRRHCDRSSTS